MADDSNTTLPSYTHARTHAITHTRTQSRTHAVHAAHARGARTRRTHTAHACGARTPRHACGARACERWARSCCQPIVRGRLYVLSPDLQARRRETDHSPNGSLTACLLALSLAHRARVRMRVCAYARMRTRKDRREAQSTHELQSRNAVWSTAASRRPVACHIMPRAACRQHRRHLLAVCRIGRHRSSRRMSPFARFSCSHMRTRT